MTTDDISEFSSYLRNCSDRQVQGVYEKERDAAEYDEEREAYVELTKNEAARRGIWLDD